MLDKARVHRHPALDSRLTWPKWSEPNMRSPPLRSRQESTCPPVKVSIYKLQLHPLLLFVSRTKIQSSGRHHRPQLFSWNLYSTRSAHMSISVMLYFHGSHLDSNVGSPSLHAPFSADLAPESTNTWGGGWRSSKLAVEAKLHPKIASVTIGENTKTTRRGSAPDPKRTMSTEKRDIFIGIRSQDEFSWTSGGSPLV